MTACFCQARSIADRSTPIISPETHIELTPRSSTIISLPRLPNFSRALGQGHDVTLGSCMLIRWGNNSTFAVVRVTKMYDGEGGMTYSQKLNRKSRKQQFRVELLVPRVASDSSVQRYGSSGWRLGPVAGTMVLCLIDLIPVAKVKDASLEARRSDAFLPIEKMLELQGRGLTPVVLDNDGDLARYVKDQDPKAEPLEGWSRHGRCYSCKSSWHDHVKGQVVPCTQCKRQYHQECAKPTIKSAAIDNWLCSVCTGKDKCLCALPSCQEPFSEHEVLDPESLQNNELVQCSVCSVWWHQACHVPALYPLPLEFVCKDCPQKPSMPQRQNITPTSPRRQKRRQTGPRPVPMPMDRARQIVVSHCVFHCLTLSIALPHHTLCILLSHTVYSTASHCVPRCLTLCIPLSHILHSISRRTTASYNSTAPTQASNEVQVGSVLSIYWPEDQRSYKGVVKEVDGDDYHVHYHDGTKQWEDLDSMDWVFESQPSFRDTSSAHSTHIDRITWDRVN